MAGLAAKLRGQGVELREQVGRHRPAPQRRRLGGRDERRSGRGRGRRRRPPARRRRRCCGRSGCACRSCPPRATRSRCRARASRRARRSTCASRRSASRATTAACASPARSSCPGRNLEVDRKRVGYILDDTLPFIRGWKPAPGEVEKQGWAGFRPATPDSLPLLGPIPGQDGLYVAAGHGMLGVTLAPATGVAVADMVTTDRARLARADGARPHF